MCNQPKRLAAALAPVRAALVAEPPVSRWGLGYSQSGDVLLVRTPKSSDKPVDLAAPLVEVSTDCAIGQAVRDAGDQPTYGGTDNTPPFRFRRWMFALSGAPELDAIAPRLFEHVPEYLRRNVKGKHPAELVFHVFLAMLHDEGSVDDANVPVQATRRALAATIKLVAAEHARSSSAAVDRQPRGEQRSLDGAGAPRRAAAAAPAVGHRRAWRARRVVPRRPARVGRGR
jgi:hypothetical protein